MPPDSPVCHSEFQLFRESCTRLHQKLDDGQARIEGKVDTIISRMVGEDAVRAVEIARAASARADSDRIAEAHAKRNGWLLAALGLMVSVLSIPAISTAMHRWAGGHP